MPLALSAVFCTRNTNTQAPVFQLDTFLTLKLAPLARPLQLGKAWGQRRTKQETFELRPKRGPKT